MLLKLESDCFNLISLKLSYVDIINLKFTCKYAKNLNYVDFKNIFINRLLEHNVVLCYKDAIKFCENLYETGAYVAGSFILDCLYNTNYHQDIDIYDQTNPVQLMTYENQFLGKLQNYYDLNDSFDDKLKKNNLKFTQTLYQMGFKSLGSGLGPDIILRSFIHTSNNEFENIRDNVSYYDSNKSITKFTKHSIQIIPIGLTLKENERSTIPRFIRSSFDLEICQSIFNGRSLYIKNLDKILYKYDYIKPNTRFMLQVYEQDNNHEKKISIDRMNKYIERGFDIKHHPKYNEIDEFIKTTLSSNKYSTMNGRHRYNIKYIDNNEIDLSKYDY